MTYSTVAAVDVQGLGTVELTEPLVGVCTVELMQAVAQASIDCFNEEVVVVRHLTVGMDDEVVPATDGAQYLKPRLPVTLIHVDRRPAITAGCDVIEGSAKFKSQRSGHPVTVPATASRVLR